MGLLFFCVLTSIISKCPIFWTSFSMLNLQDPDAVKKWEMVAEEMRDKLKKASQRCFDEGKMSEEEKHKYFMSGKI